jgi:hypothetical protein
MISDTEGPDYTGIREHEDRKGNAARLHPTQCMPQNGHECFLLDVQCGHVLV